MHLEIGRLEKAKSRLGEAVLDPGQWPDLMQALCDATATTGAVLVQSDIRTPDVPVTPSVAEMIDSYFESNLHVTDVRAIRGVPLHQSGRRVLRDQDIFASEADMLREPLYHHLDRFGFRWWAAISFYSGPAQWAFAFQRKITEGAFEADEVEALASLADSLTDVEKLSRLVGRKALLGSLNAFEMIGEPAISLMRSGRVLEINPAAEALFDSDFGISNRRLHFSDGRASHALACLLSECADESELRLHPSSRTGNVVVAQRRAKRPLLIRVLPVHGAASSPFLGARVILVLRDLETIRRPAPAVLSELFSLTPAETRIASMIAAGLSPDEISGQLQISVQTVRNQIKAVFAKTGTHRQSELAVLISRVAS